MGFFELMLYLGVIVAFIYKGSDFLKSDGIENMSKSKHDVRVGLLNLAIGRIGLYLFTQLFKGRPYFENWEIKVASVIFSIEIIIGIYFIVRSLVTYEPLRSAWGGRETESLRGNKKK